eukprot:m.46722 g.46722  ORF g.46722 m.46722 type:complete len:65 (+) comp33728_c0_seq3:297-491(+)
MCDLLNFGTSSLAGKTATMNKVKRLTEAKLTDQIAHFTRMSTAPISNWKVRHLIWAQPFSCSSA